MIKFLQKLIQIESLSPRDEGCFELIETRLKKLNFDCERIDYLNVENFMPHMERKESYFVF
jgi:succinyl-diaminopimelate desuccinylase